MVTTSTPSPTPHDVDADSSSPSSEKGFFGSLVQSIFEVLPLVFALSCSMSNISVAWGQQRCHPCHERLFLSPADRPIRPRLLDELGFPRRDVAGRVDIALGRHGVVSARLAVPAASAHCVRFVIEIQKIPDRPDNMPPSQLVTNTAADQQTDDGTRKTSPETRKDR